MKRRQFLKSASVGLAGSAVAAAPAISAPARAAPAVVSSTPPVRWRLTSSFPKTLDTLWGASETLARYCAEATDGQFQIHPSQAGEIVPGLQALDAVSSGNVEMCHTASYYYYGRDPTWALFCTVPFGLNTRQQNAWFYEGNGMKLMNGFIERAKVIALLGGNTGAQMGGWFRREIKSVSDFNGLKMRIPGLAGRTLQKLGVVPQQLVGADIYPALERGTIDAVEWVGPYDDEKLGFHKVARYYYYPGWWEGAAATHFMINLSKWNDLPKSYQAVLTTAAALANSQMTAAYDIRNPQALRRLVGGGAQLRAFPLPVLEACQKAANEVFAEINASNADFKRIYDDMIAFRNDQYLWWQVAEFTFDSFMIRSRSRG